ncbi:MAG: CRISPR system precrRNA processing endoribonuclease RAMP protein Cas6 [Caldilineaceae bacterium]
MDRNRQLSLHFQTPTKLKHQGRFLEGAPPFHVVVRSLMRRVSSLSYFHCGERWETDFKGWIEQAERVAIVEAASHWVEHTRFSTRQQRHMKLSGVTGAVTYKGDVAPFIPLLRLGELIHVGKGAVFGNGKYQIRVASGG